MDALLEIRDLSVEFAVEGARVRAVRDASLTVPRGRTLAVVGESGSGKSTLALSLLGLTRGHTRGSLLWTKGAGEPPVDLAALPDDSEAFRRIRGREIAMVFQEPATALNPVYTIGEQIAEGMRAHLGLSRAEARARAVGLLQKVGIADPALRARSFPHELSGGMRQRAVIAVALAAEPSLLVADEPTASLDVTVQAQILDLLRARQAESGMTVLLITHDFGVVAELADDVAVMYAGEIVETARVAEIFHDPQHPYTRALLASSRGINAIPGSVPDPRALPAGCAFHPRCPEATDACTSPAPLVRLGEGRTVRCVARAHPAEDRADA